MMADLPHTLYKRKDTKKNEEDDYNHALALQEEANRKALERRKKRESQTVEELFEE